MNGKLKVIAVGQLVPDNSGQAVMIRRLAESNFQSIEMHVVPMNLSEDVSDMGRFRLKKVVKVISSIARILIKSLRTRASVLYYCPGGDAKLVVIRDILVLAIVRPVFRKTIFHFHAPFTEDAYFSLTHLLRPLFRFAFFFPDLTIRITEYNPPVNKFLRAKKDIVVPNGIPDTYDPSRKKSRNTDELVILFVGKVSSEKGIWELMESFVKLANVEPCARLEIVGSFETPQIERELTEAVRDNHLNSRVLFYGSPDTNQRDERYYSADIFCMPTYFETFGLTILEAMQFEVPIVSCSVGGVKALVKEGVNGLLVPPRRVDALTEALNILFNDHDLRVSMGRAGREIFLSEFTLDQFRSTMEQAIVSVSFDVHNFIAP